MYRPDCVFRAKKISKELNEFDTKSADGYIASLSCLLTLVAILVTFSLAPTQLFAQSFRPALPSQQFEPWEAESPGEKTTASHPVNQRPAVVASESAVSSSIERPVQHSLPVPPPPFQYDESIEPQSGSNSALPRPEFPGSAKPINDLPVDTSSLSTTHVAQVAQDDPAVLSVEQSPLPFALPLEEPIASVDGYSQNGDVGLVEPIIAPLQIINSDPTTIGCQTCGTSELTEGYSDVIWGGTRIGRFLRGVHAGICCPDPCYQPQWTMLSNASFFTESVRPQTRQRFRWDYYGRYPFPDAAEYLWARSGSLGPAAQPSIDYHDLTFYVETGAPKFSFFVATPYRSIYQDNGHFAGMSDIHLGTKTLLHDTSLIQFAFQFKTYIPTASFSKGLGTAHVSLEPSLLMGIQLSQRSFFQAELGEWIPIAGDAEYAGALLKYSASYNRTLIQTASRTNLIGTIEYSGISFQDGAYTDPTTLLPVQISDQSIGRLGGGLRLNICDKVNFGIGIQSGVTDLSPNTTIRTEIQFQR